MEALQILMEDDFLILPVKPPLCNSEHTPDHTGLPDLLVKEHGNYIAPIHRLDFGVGGLLLCAKKPEAAAALSKSIADGRVQKEYLALVHGELPESGHLEDLLFYDRRAGKSFVADSMRKGVKAASLSYFRMETRKTPWGNLSLLRVLPETGRTHQIRLQFASRGYPLLGDRKYGAKESCRIGLYCSRLTFPHPKTGELVTIESIPQGDAWDLFF